MKNLQRDRQIYPLFTQSLNSNIYLASILGIDHGIADATAGFILGGLPRIHSLEQASLAIVIYNIVSFGCQPVIGLFIDRLKAYKLSTFAGLFCLLTALSLSKVSLPIIVTVILAGIGSAAFHVGGGALAINSTPNRTTGPGIFAAPGVVGLAIGGILGLTGYEITELLAILLGIFIPVTALIKVPKIANMKRNDRPIENSEERDWTILGLASAIAIISTLWTSFQFLLQTQLQIVIAIAIIAAISKTVGGIIADIWGGQNLTVASLLISAVLLATSEQNQLNLILGLGLLQANIPVTLTAMATLMPKQPATAASFALGLAIFIGSIPIMGGLSYLIGTPVVAAAIATTATVLLSCLLKFIKRST